MWIKLEKGGNSTDQAGSKIWVFQMRDQCFYIYPAFALFWLLGQNLVKMNK